MARRRGDAGSGTRGPAPTLNLLKLDLTGTGLCGILFARLRIEIKSRFGQKFVTKTQIVTEIP